MTAEHYIREKERLSQALCGPSLLAEAVSDITETLTLMRCMGYTITSNPWRAK